MADLFSVTAPLAVRHADGTRRVMVERFARADGLLYFEPFWHLQRPAARGMHLLRGEIRGEGPWKIDGAVITVLGCHGTDAELAESWAEWQAFLESGAPGYPVREAIESLAAAYGQG